MFGVSAHLNSEPCLLFLLAGASWDAQRPQPVGLLGGWWGVGRGDGLDFTSLVRQVAGAELGAGESELSPGGADHSHRCFLPPFSPRELNGNNITRIHKNDFSGLKQLRVL